MTERTGPGVVQIAALYVDPNGIYAGLPDVELWGEERDARLYAGPHPVVAHPPCARWCALAHLVESMHGYRVGEDGGCFEAALAAVRTWGGVLEHPAYSIAWKQFGLPRPSRGYWRRSLLDEGWVTELSQSAYGHPATKRTWLYYVGPEPQPVRWGSPAVSRMVSSFGHGRKVSESERVRPKLASATPAPFRDVLLELARSSTREEVAA